jgi:polyphosphate glucokinase
MAVNMDPEWIDVDADALFEARLGDRCRLVNDADGAGIAEMRFGAGRDVGGVVIVCTLGTGIGTAVFVDGTLVPNTELGHLEIDGVAAESRAAGRCRKSEGLTWQEWALRLDRYLAHLEMLFWPGLFILGGGVSRRTEKFFDHLDRSTPIVGASLANNAGVVGAALLATGAEDA